MINATKSPRTTQKEGQYGQSGGGEGVSRAIERSVVPLCSVQRRWRGRRLGRPAHRERPPTVVPHERRTAHGARVLPNEPRSACPHGDGVFRTRAPPVVSRGQPALAGRWRSRDAGTPWSDEEGH